MHGRMWLLSAGLFTFVGCQKSPPPPETPVAVDEALQSEPADETAVDPGLGDYDPCAGKTCGESCTVCPPDSTDCMETAVVKTCDATGQCTANAGPC